MLESPAQSSAAAPPQDAASITRVSDGARAWPVVGEHVWTWLISAVFVLSLGLRLNCLDCYSLWYDEIASVETVQRGWDAIFGYRFGWVGNQTPLHYLLVWLTAQAADPAETAMWVRLPSVLAGALLVPVTYRLGTVLFTRAHGLVAALLVALTPTLLDYSQELRPYSMMTFLTLLSVLALVEAARGGSAWWWGIFALSSVLNALNSVVALLMVLPPLGLYALWLAWGLWRRRSMAAARGNLSFLLLSMLSIGAAALPTLIEALGVPRQISAAGGFSFSDFSSLFVVITSWYVRLDTGGWIETAAHLLFMALTIGGAALAIRARGEGRRGAVLLLLFVLVPLIVFTYLMSRYFVTQRYVLFTLPFYMLLVSYALLEPFRLVSEWRGHVWVRVAAALPLGFAAAVIGWGAVSYAQVDEVGRLPEHRVGMRDAAHYLSAAAGPDDTIIFLGRNSLANTVAGYYWQGNPPAPAFDACDPRLASHRAKGDLFWVYTVIGPAARDELAAANKQGWKSTFAFRQGVILREGAHREEMGPNLDRFLDQLHTLEPFYHAYPTLDGCTAQANDRYDTALARYVEAEGVANRALGIDYLRTARGFEERNLMREAWREAIVSKHIWPGNSELHLWMAEHLEKEGMTSEAEFERRLAAELAALSR
jgi:4-amino-4-deoxy-L-arabinose transferase-like glycosyltransferase